MPIYEPLHDRSFAHIFVWSTDLVAANSFAKRLLRSQRAILIAGDVGTGKTKFIREFIRCSADQYLSTSINLNYYATATSLQRQLEMKVSKRSGKTYGPPSGRQLLIFVDDLNSPALDAYETQPPLELLRQQMDSKEIFDRADLTLRKEIVDVLYSAAINPKAGSFHIATRLERHFTAVGFSMSSLPNSSSILVSHFESNRFTTAVRNFSLSVSKGTFAFHKEMQLKFLPSAIKFTYQFTLKDIAQVFEGICRSRHSTVKTRTDLGRLFVHECLRVYTDRLHTATEITRAHSILVDVVKQHLTESGDSPDAVFTEPNHWTAFIQGSTHSDHTRRQYAPISNMDSLKEVLSDQLAEYNQSNPIMNLVLFTEAMEHVVRIARIVGLPHGHALLIGIGGSGKQSLARLASFLLNYSAFQIALTSTYDIACFKEDLKDVYRKAGVKPAMPLSFILAETQIIDEQFLVYLNDFLASGSIPELFSREEFDAIFASIRNVAKAAGVPDSYESLMQFFIDRVSSNVHVVLSFSPIGEKYSLRARRFPALTNATCIDVFHPWPRDALVSVAQHFLCDVLDNDNLAYHVAEVHLSVHKVSQNYLESEKRYNYVTPTSYLELISFYKKLLEKRQNEMNRMIKRLDTGLTTLRVTNEDVSRLEANLKVKKNEVDQKRGECDEFLQKMGRQRGEAELAQAEADRERTKADTAAQEARTIEEQAAGDLALAKPALDAALDAVNCLDKASMTELKSFQKPPPGVDKVTATVLILIKNEKKNFGWENAKKMMAKVDAFKEQLEAFRGEDIPPELVQRCEPYLADPNFSYDKMKTKSMAAANLCNWVVNIITFNRVYKKVKPLMDQLEQAQKAKQIAEGDLAAVKKKLATIDGTLEELQRSFLEATHEKATVERVLKECESRLALAERLTSGLASEYSRWGSEIDQLRKIEGTLLGESYAKKPDGISTVQYSPQVMLH